MQVILLERVAKLGQMGEVVKVKEGYARNFLLPQGKALRASQSNIDAFEAQKNNLEARNAESRSEAEKSAKRLDGLKFVIIRSASDAGSLYGSVTPRDVETVAADAGQQIDRKQIVLGNPIKELGLHDIKVVLHPEVEATVTLNIARSHEEAELQAQGKSIQDMAAEADAEAEFEIAELFDDIGSASVDDLEDSMPSSRDDDGDADDDAR